MDQHWIRVPGGHGVVEANDEAVYLAIALRNVGRGMAVLDSWTAQPEMSGRRSSRTTPRWMSSAG